MAGALPGRADTTEEEGTEWLLFARVPPARKPPCKRHERSGHERILAETRRAAAAGPQTRRLGHGGRPGPGARREATEKPRLQPAPGRRRHLGRTDPPGTQPERQPRKINQLRLQLITGPARLVAGTMRNRALLSTWQGLGGDQRLARGRADHRPGPQERIPLDCSAAGFLGHLLFFLLMTKGGRAITSTPSLPGSQSV